MPNAGFFEPRGLSPTGLTIVIAMHAAALGALALVKGPEIIDRIGPTRLIDISTPTEPDPEPLPPPPQNPSTAQPRSVMDSTPTPVRQPTRGPVVIDLAPPPQWPVEIAGVDPVPAAPADPPPAPVRRDAEFDPRFAGEVQPPYPPAEERAGREGSVRLSLTIGADGRVKAVQRLSATSDAFWQVTERHALARWRFRPATVDGRPVESRKVVNLQFELRS